MTPKIALPQLWMVVVKDLSGGDFGVVYDFAVVGEIKKLLRFRGFLSLAEARHPTRFFAREGQKIEEARSARRKPRHPKIVGSWCAQHLVGTPKSWRLGFAAASTHRTVRCALLRSSAN